MKYGVDGMNTNLSIMLLQLDFVKGQYSRIKLLVIFDVCPVINVWRGKE